MNIKELQIGDYVTFKDCQNDDAPSIVKIEGLGYQGRGVVEEALVTIDGDENGFDLVEIDDEFVGIPLTPEILEKNGFEIQEQGGGRIDVWTGCGPDAEGDIEIEFDNGVPIHLKIDAAYKGEYYTSNNIHFLHDLQHALRLCGIEKEIEL